MTMTSLSPVEDAARRRRAGLVSSLALAKYLGLDSPADTSDAAADSQPSPDAPPQDISSLLQQAGIANLPLRPGEQGQMEPVPNYDPRHPAVMQLLGGLSGPRPPMPVAGATSPPGENAVDAAPDGSPDSSADLNLSHQLRRYLKMPDLPDLPPAPTRDLRGEAVRSGIGALVSGLILHATGNGSAVAPSVAAYLAGSKRGNEEVFQNEQQQQQNTVQERFRKFQLQRQDVSDENAVTSRENASDLKQRLDNSHAKQAELGKLRSGWPSYVKSLRESNPLATGQDLGKMAQSYIDRADDLAGGAGKSGITLRQQSVLPSEAATTTTDEDGNVITTPPDSKAGGIFPVVDPIQPKKSDELAAARAADSFMASLKGLSPGAVQSRIKTADENGILETLGVTIPKGKDGLYQFDASAAPPLRPLPDAAEDRKKQIAADLAFARSQYKDSHATTAGRLYWSKQIKLKEGALGVGSGAAIPSGLISDMTPAEKESVRQRQQGLNIAQQNANRPRGGSGTNSGARDSRELSLAYGRVASITSQIETIKAQGDSPANRYKIKALRGSLAAAQSQIRSLGSNPGSYSDSVSGGSGQVKPAGEPQPVNFGDGIDEFTIPGGARFGMGQLGSQGYGAEVRDVQTDAQGNTQVWFEAPHGGRYKGDMEKRAIKALEATGARNVHWATDGYRASFPGEAQQAASAKKARIGKTPGGRNMTIEEAN